MKDALSSAFVFLPYSSAVSARESVLVAVAVSPVATASVRISGLSAGRDTSLDSSLYSRFVVEDESSSSGIDLDSRALGENQKAEFKELHFCYEGRLAKGKFLMTEPDIYE